MKRLAWYASVLCLAIPAVRAQQVQVFSEGRPVAVADAANTARARIKDERKARRPLAERPDAIAIAKAHATSMLRCGLDESKYPPDRIPSPQESAYAAAHASYIPVPNTTLLLLMDEYQRGKAIVDTEPLAILTPQCPAGVGAMYWSADGAQVAFATQPVTGMEFPGGSRALWAASFAKVQDVWHYDSGGKRFHKVISLPKEKVVDIHVPEAGGAVWILSQVEKLDLRTPRTWLRAASGTPARKMTIVLRQVDLKGNVIAKVTVADGVSAGFAQFLRQ